MQARRKRSKAGIIIIVAVVVVLIAVMVVWNRYEAAHKSELQASVRTTDLSQIAPIDDSERQPEAAPAVPERVIPDDAEKLLVMAEEALKDEGYFKEGDRNKGFHVYFLLKKCLDCDGEASKVEGLAKRLKERSDQGYGPWHLSSAELSELDGKIEAAKQM